MKRCPVCHHDTQQASTLCIYCGYEFWVDPAHSQSPTPQKPIAALRSEDMPYLIPVTYGIFIIFLAIIISAVYARSAPSMNYPPIASNFEVERAMDHNIVVVDRSLRDDYIVTSPDVIQIMPIAASKPSVKVSDYYVYQDPLGRIHVEYKVKVTTDGSQ